MNALSTRSELFAFNLFQVFIYQQGALFDN